MNTSQYLRLSKELQQLIREKQIPLNWGAVQNDKTDNKIKLFDFTSFDELKIAIASLTNDEIIYFKRRWFLSQCAKCDEYLFNLNETIKKNPNSRDQGYDIEFNDDETLRFDVKGTIIPKFFRANAEEIIKDPTPLVDYFYEHQSLGVRNHMQNRLFIIHHSFKKPERELVLRCYWKFKEEVFKKYAAKISSDSKFFTCKNVKADVIFVLENKNGNFEYRF
ncbi:MAG: hypothetical protein EOO47_11045 [Flavobacterium sp.]|nr:MAG: hypothetical protein EOO47_11045 [Flavobacterium sp.]